jgi:hypothetical protein
MRSPEQAMKRWLHPAVFATWTGFLIYILASQRYVAFLRPEFGILLALAHVIAMGFMLAAIIRTKTTEMDASAILRALVLLTPVLYYAAMPDTMMGNQAFKKRFIGTNNGVISRQAPSILSPQESENDPDIASQPEEIDGIFDLQQINGKPVPIILKPQIKPVEAPAVPYLF